VIVECDAGAQSPSPSSIAPTWRAEICPTPSRWRRTAVLVVGRHAPFIGPAISDSEISAQHRRPVPRIECVQTLSMGTQTISW